MEYDDLFRFLRMLPKRSAQAYLCYHVFGWTMSQVAKEMKLSEGTVKRYIHDVRCQLYDLARQENIDDTGLVK